MKIKLFLLFALFGIVISSCSVNEELVLLEEVDDVYISPDKTLASGSPTALTQPQPVLEPMPGASNAEMSYYAGLPYVASDETDPEPASAQTDEDDEYYDYFDEDYASRLENFDDDNIEGDYLYGQEMPVTSNWPRFTWNIGVGFGSYGYGGGYSASMNFGNGCGYSPFYDPFYDPFNPWGNRCGCPGMYGPQMGYNMALNMNYGFGYPGFGYPGYGYPGMYNPYYGGISYIDGGSWNNYAYNNQPSSSRRSRGGVVTSGNSDGGNGGINGLVTNNNSERRNAVNTRSSKSTGSVTRGSYNRQSAGRTGYTTERRGLSTSSSTRRDVSPYTRQRETRNSQINTRSSSRYNSVNRTRSSGNNSFYQNQSRSRSSSPTFSSPSRSRSGGSVSPSRSTPSRGRR